MARGALRAAAEIEWPGNLRQLENCIEAAAIRCAGERRTVIEIEDLFPDAARASNADVPGLTLQAATQKFQCQYVRQVLEDEDWEISKVLKRLDISRSHLYHLIRLAGMKRGSRST